MGGKASEKEREGGWGVVEKGIYVKLANGLTEGSNCEMCGTVGFVVVHIGISGFDLGNGSNSGI